MKKIIPFIFILLIASVSQAFDFGGLAKAVTGQTSDSNAALKSKQKAMVASYTESKENLLKGYANVLESLGQTSLANEAKQALNVVENKKDTTVKELTQLSNDISTKTQKAALEKSATQVSDEMKKKYTEGLEYFKKAIEGEISAGSQAVEIANETKAIISSGSTVERIELATTFEPTTTLIKTIPSDISKLKKNISTLVELAKSRGIEVPNALMSVLK